MGYHVIFQVVLNTLFVIGVNPNFYHITEDQVQVQTSGFVKVLSVLTWFLNLMNDISNIREAVHMNVSNPKELIKFCWSLVAIILCSVTYYVLWTRSKYFKECIRISKCKWENTRKTSSGLEVSVLAISFCAVNVLAFFGLSIGGIVTLPLSVPISLENIVKSHIIYGKHTFFLDNYNSTFTLEEKLKHVEIAPEDYPIWILHAFLTFYHIIVTKFTRLVLLSAVSLTWHPVYSCQSKRVNENPLNWKKRVESVHNVQNDSKTSRVTTTRKNLNRNVNEGYKYRRKSNRVPLGTGADRVILESDEDQGILNEPSSSHVLTKIVNRRKQVKSRRKSNILPLNLVISESTCDADEDTQSEPSSSRVKRTILPRRKRISSMSRSRCTRVTPGNVQNAVVRVGLQSTDDSDKNLKMKIEFESISEDFNTNQELSYNLNGALGEVMFLWVVETTLGYSTSFETLFASARWANTALVVYTLILEVLIFGFSIDIFRRMDEFKAYLCTRQRLTRDFPSDEVQALIQDIDCKKVGVSGVGVFLLNASVAFMVITTLMGYFLLVMKDDRV